MGHDYVIRKSLEKVGYNSGSNTTNFDQKTFSTVLFQRRIDALSL